MSAMMKASGIEWIGKIPTTWNTERIKDLSAEITGGGTPKSSIDEYWEGGDIIWMTPTDFQYFKNTKYIDDSKRKITELGLGKCSAKLLPINTVVMSSRASIGISKLTAVELTTNQGFISFLPSFRLSNDFLYYCIEGYLGSYFQVIASGTTFMEISPKVVKQEQIPLPPIQEQKSIANFLDKSTSKIVDAIKTKQVQLKTLEALKKSIIHKAVTKGLDDSVVMKDSGIEWIGGIPKHWNTERIKDLSAEITGGGTPKSSIDEYWEDGNIIWMTPTDFQDFEDTKYIDDSKRKITELGLRKCSAKLLPINTVVMSSRASIGTPKLTSVELSTNQGFISFLPSFRLNNDFLYYCIEGYLGSYFQIIASGTTFMEISPKIAKQEKIPLPSMKEQEAISLYLDKEVKKMNTLKSNVENQINKLKEYKKSLIYEYVTGKKQVKE